jgi:glycerol-3-phosphate dehydrogenase (NAD(P)+)
MADDATGVRTALAVVGTGAWGVTLAMHAARLGTSVVLLARTPEEASALRAAGSSPRLPGCSFPVSLRVDSDPSSLSEAPIVIMAVPAQTMRANVRTIRARLAPGAIVVSASKGLEIGSARRMSEVILEELSSPNGRLVGALSGPNLAAEVAAGKAASTVVACADEGAAARVQAALMAPHLRVYTSKDIVGVELGGALKNVIALGAGMADGLDAGDNGKAALMTRGLVEIARLGKAAGAEPLTFSGLAGLGDLIATCMSPLSRNRTLGQALALGRRPDALQTEGQTGSRQVAEGVPTTVAALQLARRYDVEMPITTLMHRVLFEGLSPREAGAALMQRDPKRELEGFV